jgi:hypothetical protein
VTSDAATTLLQMTIISSSISIRKSLFAIGSAQGRLMVYDIASQARVADNSGVHSDSELLKIGFQEVHRSNETLLITGSRDG